MAGTDREKALDAALAQIERQFGKGAVMRLGERPNEPIEVIPTGSTALDVALGVGGLPRGRVVEVYGPESSGKTTLTLHAVANAQQAGGTVAFVDAEHALDPEYAKKLGVDIDNLILSQPDNGEQALEIVDMLVRSGALDLIVIDSVAALVPRAEIEGEMGDSHVGLQARLMSQALRKITSALNQSKTTAIFINQLREKIGVMFGSPETTTGGRALKFYASVRLDIRRIETLKDGTDAVGNRTRVKVVKNKVAPPFKQAEFDILYGQGISREGGLIDMGVEHGFVRKSGAWYTYEGDQLGQGKENARNFLKDNPDLADEIEKKIKEKLGVGVRPEEPSRRAGRGGGGRGSGGRRCGEAGARCRGHQGEAGQGRGGQELGRDTSYGVAGRPRRARRRPRIRRRTHGRVRLRAGDRPRGAVRAPLTRGSGRGRRVRRRGGPACPLRHQEQRLPFLVEGRAGGAAAQGTRDVSRRGRSVCACSPGPRARASSSRTPCASGRSPTRWPRRCSSRFEDVGLIDDAAFAGRLGGVPAPRPGPGPPRPRPGAAHQGRGLRR